MAVHLTLKEASKWATSLLGREITPSNISYLIQYGRIKKVENSQNTFINKQDLEKYYINNYKNQEYKWKQQLGNSFNRYLSFAEYKEAETTKHVHRLHPYKGKFIPQLVEYFLDQHTDEFKQEVYFKPNDIIFDPFCGSGTTLVQSNELNLHALGVDVSSFNAFISNSKIGNYDTQDIWEESNKITDKLKSFRTNDNNIFELQLTHELKIFNNNFFPSPDYKYKVQNNLIDEYLYGKQRAEEFLEVYHALIHKYKILLKQRNNSSFLDIWFLQPVRNEIDYAFSQIKLIENISTRKILALILSRTIRSCRATTHADLGTLKEPITATYYCKKHGKICKPVFSILNWWQRYVIDSIKRIEQFTQLKTHTHHYCLAGDSRSIDICEALSKKNKKFSDLIKENKINGIFTSPPYVGLIDYHEQHAYAYDLFGFERKDKLEIGPLSKKQGYESRQSYIRGVADVLLNCKSFLKQDYHVFIVANDKYNLYPQIAKLSGMQIIKEYKRPVLNRVEKNRTTYSESIFHLQEN